NHYWCLRALRLVVRAIVMDSPRRTSSVLMVSRIRTTCVSARIGFGRGFRRIAPRRVAHFAFAIDEITVNDRSRQALGAQAMIDRLSLPIVIRRPSTGGRLPV